MNWSKLTAWARPDSTSAFVFQLYSSDSVPPGKRITLTPALLISPGTAESTTSPS